MTTNLRALWRSGTGHLLVVLGATGLLIFGAAPAMAVDEQAPQVNFKGVQYIANTMLSDSTSSPSLPVRVVWGKYDPSGICSGYARLYNYDTGRYTYPAFSPYRDSVRVNLKGGVDYQLMLYLQDCAGNASYYYDYVGLGSLHQETETALSAGWTTSTCLCWSGGNVFWNTRTGAKASFTFNGRSVAWITDRADNRGTANVYLDGRFVAAVNLQGAGVNRIVGYQKRFGSSGTHTLDIVVAGTPGHPRVDIDAFLVSY